MIQVVNYFCSKCNSAIKPGDEKTLQLVDRVKLQRAAYGREILLTPSLRWEYTLCRDCFDKFQEGMKLKYEE